MDGIILHLDAFVRSIGVAKSSPQALFLGSGASISSGIPSAERCIWEWKCNIFLTNNPGLERQFSEISLPNVQQKIQDWLDSKGMYPSRGALEEYGFYIEKCYPLSEDRRLYFQKKVQNARPHIGYKLACLLAQNGIIKSVWTTNFDSLFSKASGQFSITVKEVGIDCQHRVDSQYRAGEVLHVSMHGDYRYDKLKNTSQEVQQQETKLQNQLIEHLKDTSLIVVGYSGRDASLMNAFKKAYSQPGFGSLYWCGYSENIPPVVENLTQTAKRNKRKAFYVQTQGFDDLLFRLSSHCLEGSALQAVEEITSGTETNNNLVREPFEIDELPVAALIKSNFFRIECPSEVFEFGLKKWPQKGVWKSVESTVANRELVAVPFKTKILCLGIIDEIKEVFGDNIDGEIQRIPISDKDLRFEDSAMVSLFLRALCGCLSKYANILTDGKRMLWFHENPRREVYRDGEYLVYDSALLFLRCFWTQTYLIIKPSIKVADKFGNDVTEEIELQIKLKILGYQHNKKFNVAMDNWRKRLFSKKDGWPIFEYPSNSGSGFKFKIKPVPDFAKIGSRIQKRPLNLLPNITNHLKQTGVQLLEPPLLFSNRQGSRLIKDTHPIRGIVTNQPYDYPLTQRGLAPDIKLAVICPDKEKQLLAKYLYKIHQKHSPNRTQRDYLLDFPGFANAFGLSIQVPQPGDPHWFTCSEPSSDLDAKTGSLKLSEILRHSVNTVMASTAPDVLLIFIPDRWKTWRGFKTDIESFDLHNFVKAFCVQRGITSQFLEQETLSNAYQCRIWWWLSLALYVKSMRTPWLLDCLDDKAAFVGLGFSLDRKSTKEGHVILGCSHIYNAQGEGLQYRLSKIENPLIRQGNPFMSKDDARRVGEIIRQLFYESRLTLPDRVVIHKRTPFLREEREGLCEGLEGVNHIDMIEINIDRSIRYVASKVDFKGSFAGDNYPVRRGTTIKLDNYTALLWVHGSTSALNPRLNYYQGKRRIPAPLIVRRHGGNSDLEVIAREILGLSKMNWNTFDLYTKLPATVQSSGQIARIGSLLQRFGTAPYDYRLFI